MLVKQKVEEQWEKIKNTEIPFDFEHKPNESIDLAKESYNEILRSVHVIEKVFGSIGYLPFVLTIKRGFGNPNLKDQLEVFSSTLKEFNSLLFRYRASSGLEIPSFAFEGNAIDGSHNSHLHALVFFPGQYKEKFATILQRQGLNHRSEELRNGREVLVRTEASYWLQQASSINPYIRYGMRLEDPFKVKGQDKLTMEMMSFGFKSSKDDDKRSPKFYNRMLKRFPEAERDFPLRIKIFAMLHWICLQKKPNEYFRIFIPPLETEALNFRNRSIEDQLVLRSQNKNKIVLTDRRFFIKKSKRTYIANGTMIEKQLK